MQVSMGLRIHRKILSKTKSVTAPLLLLSAAFASVSTAAHAAGPNLETFVMSTNGVSKDPTRGQPAAVFNTFGDFGDIIPQDAEGDASVLASEGVSGTFRVKDSSTTSTLTDSYGSSGATGDYSFSGSTTATAAYGQLKSGSQATISGNGISFYDTNTAESYATMLDTLTPTSPHVVSSTSGTIRLAFTIDGSLSIVDNASNPGAPGEGVGGLEFLCSSTTDGSTPTLSNYYSNTATTLLAAQLEIYGNGGSAEISSSTYGLGAPTGMTYSVGPAQASGSPSYLSLTGSTTLFVTIPTVFGSATAFDLGLLTWVNPNQNSDDGALFQDTATLSGIQVFDNNGNAVNDFSITSGSGTLYDANGVHLTGNASAPEPGSFALLAAGALGGLPAVKLIARLRQRRAPAGLR